MLASKDLTNQDQLRLFSEQLDEHKSPARKAESEKQSMNNIEISNKLLREQIERDRIQKKLGNYKDHELEFDNWREKVQKFEEQ